VAAHLAGQGSLKDVSPACMVERGWKAVRDVARWKEPES
jgi:hypothetical protein